MTQPDDDLFEAYDADIPRVDLVKTSANGTSFLLMKSGAGLLSADEVEALVKEADSDTKPAIPTPLEVFAKAGYEAFIKAKYTAEDKRAMAANGEAMQDESYPIKDADDLDKAIHAVGRGGADHDAIRRHVIKRAKALGKSSDIPDNWNADGSLKETAVTKTAELEPETDDVVKAADDPVDGLDPTVMLAETGEDAPGDPNEPGSPAWEAIDAATAVKWSAILSRAKNALALLADREWMEADTVDPSDADNGFNLDDAGCAIDYAISVLAPFAVDEQNEVDVATEALDSILKAAAGLDVAALDVIEGYEPIRKAGKVLSAANESAIRAAVESLQNVLSTLPQAEEAPVTKTAEPEAPEETEDVTKGAEPPADVAPLVAPETDSTSGEPEPAEPVAKAKGDPQMAVFDSNGTLVGTCDPADLSPIAAPTPPAGGDAQGAAAAPDATADAAPAAPAATDDTTTDAPAAGSTDAPPATDGSDSTTIPGTDTVQAPPDDDDTVAKAAHDESVATLTSAFAAALKEVLPDNEAVIKAAVGSLEERLARVEAQPAAGGPLLNGANGAAGLAARTADDPDGLIELRKAAAEETDPIRKAELQSGLALQVMKQAQAGGVPAKFKPSTPEEVLHRFRQ